VLGSKLKSILILYELSGVFRNLYRHPEFNGIHKDWDLDKEDIRLMNKPQ
jgi:hypothetical protein